MVNEQVWQELSDVCAEHSATLIAVSKKKPVAAIEALYALGQRDFGENYVQELTEKAAALPQDIRWHFIGHLQTNKVKAIAPFAHRIHTVDSFRLLQEIEKSAARAGRIIQVLLQMHIAEEETKYGMDMNEATELLDYHAAQKAAFTHTQICGLMGMATNTDDTAQIEKEFAELKNTLQLFKDTYFAQQPAFKELSMGMSGDYLVALRQGSTAIRIGSLLFGER